MSRGAEDQDEEQAWQDAQAWFRPSTADEAHQAMGALELLMAKPSRESTDRIIRDNVVPIIDR